MHVAVVDVGSLKNLGWAIRGPEISEDGSDLDLCIDAIIRASKIGPVALGFEAPMFVPLREDILRLNKARAGEGNLAFSGSVGATVLVTALSIVPYTLRKLRQHAPHLIPTFAWRSVLTLNSLLLFEAFVSNQKKTSDLRHIEDAALAVSEFQTRYADLSAFESSLHEPDVLNLLGAALLRTGWTSDLGVLSAPCLVVKV